MEEIKMMKGRLYIPTALIMDKFKPKMGKVKEAVWKNFPGARWSSGYWVVVADEQAIATCNIIFGTSFTTKQHDISKISYPFKTKPRRCQLEALAACGGSPAFAYFMEPGLGKTKAFIDDVQILARDGKVEVVVVLSPKSVIPTWIRQIDEHGHSENWAISYWNSDTSPARGDVIRAPQRPQLYWLIMPIHSITGTRAWEYLYKVLCSSAKIMVGIDESTNIKGATAKRTHQAWKIRDYAEYRRILTGTPMADGKPMDFYAQMAFLDPEIFDGMSFDAYKRHYAVLGGFKNREILGYRNQGELASRIAQYSFTARKADYEDLPPRSYDVREVTLTPRNMRNYEAIANEVMLQVKDKVLTVDTVGAKIIKLRQLCGGWVLPDKDEDKKVKREPIAMGTEKLEDLMELVEECRSIKVIVWCYFIHEVHALYDKLTKAGFRAAKYYGGVSIADRGRIEKEFEDGKLDVMVIQVDTGCMGLTLNAASLMVFYSNTNYLLPRSQAEERNYRIGQTKATTIIDQVVIGTVDESIYRLLSTKKDAEKSFMAALKDPAAMENLLFPPKQRGGWKHGR